MNTTKKQAAVFANAALAVLAIATSGAALAAGSGTDNGSAGANAAASAYRRAVLEGVGDSTAGAVNTAPVYGPYATWLIHNGVSVDEALSQARRNGESAPAVEAARFAAVPHLSGEQLHAKSLGA